MKKLKWFLIFLVFGMVLPFPSPGLSASDLSGSLDICLKANTKGFAVANFGRFDLFSCQGKNLTSGYIYLVVEKNVLEKGKTAQRRIEFYQDRWIGQKGRSQ